MTDRRAARANMPVRKYRLGEEPSDDLSAVTTPGQRLAMVWELTQRAWVPSGKPLPSYTRAEMPVRLIRLEDDGDVRHFAVIEALGEQPKS